MEEWIEAALSQWRKENVKVNLPATAASLEQAESTLGFQFPEDFGKLYLIINGFEDYEWQEHMFSLWSLERIIKEYDDANDKDFVGFCDFLISSHFIGFSKTGLNVLKKYSIVGAKEPLAGTFKEIIGFINDSHNSIY
jgi:hypothetical protein